MSNKLRKKVRDNKKHQVFITGNINGSLAGPEGNIFDMTDGGAVLIVRFDRPTHDEVMKLRKGSLTIGLTPVENVLFLTFKFAGLNTMDAPYSVHLSRGLSRLKPVSYGEGYALHIIICDTEGRVYGSRLIGLTTEFSRVLYEEIMVQRAMPFDNATHNAIIDAVYSSYTSTEIFEAAEETCSFERPALV